MLAASVVLSGIPAASSDLVRLADQSAALHTALLERARAGRDRLARATNVRTGAARDGWQVVSLGLEEVAIVNRVTNHGYSYPSGLITGTGQRAVPTTGFSGSHRGSWPGMAPSRSLHPAWEAELRIGFSLPSALTTP